ncbi:hypothetical protein ACFL0G_04865 [Candidatus Zixiibacteriota bacterium]
MPRAAKRKYLRGGSQRRKRSAHKPQIFLLILLLSVIATVLYVWVRVHVVKQQVTIADLEGKIQKLETDNEYLRMESLRLSTADHLQSIAEEYGFTYPTPHQIIRLAR